MLPKIQQWLDRDFFPQRFLLSGGKFDTLIDIAAQLQKGDEVNCEARQGESPLGERESPGGEDALGYRTKILTGICPDTLVLRNEGTLKIGDKDKPDRNSVRGLIRWVVQKPVSPHRIVIIEDFDRTGRDANHALLKVLEEPPPQAIFLFSTKNHHQILDTILSRMTVLRVPHDFQDFSIDEEVKTFFQSSNLIWKFRKISDLDKEAKKQKDKKIILKFVDDLIVHARFFTQYQIYLDSLFELQKALSSNQNPKLVLERFALQITA